MASRLLSKAALAVSVLMYDVSGLNTDDGVGANIDYGSFSNPSVYVRPRFRYWIPDASVDLAVVADDFAKAKAVGMGGLELLGYYLYGNYPSVVTEGGPVPVDWTVYGWGTQAWKNLTDAALRATKDHGMIMDFALGPNQGAGVPAEADAEGLFWDLFPYNASVPIGGTFGDILPGWGSGQFIAATTGLVTTSIAANYSASPAFKGPFYYNGTQNTLLASSLKDVTDQVDSNGRLNITFPTDVEGVEYRIFVFYQDHSLYMEQASPEHLNTTVPQSPVTSFVQNGSRVVDHFSAAGAKLVTDFWDDYLLDDETTELFRSVGNYAWEDSMEIGAGSLVWWTPALLDTFRTSRGYSLQKYLPLIYSLNTQSNGPLASPDHFYTDEADGGQSHINDYWQTLTELNQIYLGTLRNWSLESLESQFSAQVVYNLPMDMLANVPSVNAPECESLGFSHVIDAYRQFAGPANLAGKRIISSELGAQRNEVYEQTLPELIWDVKRSIVGSVNQMVFHGYPFTGNYPNSTWPGYTTFAYRFSSMHGPRQPAWEYYDDFMNWTARVQYIAQSGIPKIDLAFWLKQDAYYKVNSQYLPNDLQGAGYSYEYLSPDNFNIEKAVFVNGSFAPSRQAFKAMILRENDTLTVPGVQKLVEYAQAGLPIFFSGGLPQNLTGFNASGTELVRSALAGIQGLENVHVVPYDGLASSLNAAGIVPRTRVSAERTFYTYWREDVNSSTTYVFVYNDAWDSEFGEGSATGSITFESTGTPYAYDAWTGETSPILAYEQDDFTTTISLSLAGNQSTIIGFHHDESNTAHAISFPDGVYGASVSGSQLTLKASNSSQPVLLLNGTTVNLPMPAAPLQLDQWELTVESWSPPANISTDQTKPSLSNSTYNLTALAPWYSISESLHNVSGRGFYSATFKWPPGNSSTADGAVLELGAIYNTARAWVNGHQLPPLDPTNAVADIGEILVNGTNLVEIVVSTPLNNVMRSIWQDVKTSGTIWLGPAPDEQAYGLLQNAHRALPATSRLQRQTGAHLHEINSRPAEKKGYLEVGEPQVRKNGLPNMRIAAKEGTKSKHPLDKKETAGGETNASNSSDNKRTGCAPDTLQPCPDHFQPPFTAFAHELGGDTKKTHPNTLPKEHGAEDMTGSKDAATNTVDGQEAGRLKEEVDTTGGTGNTSEATSQAQPRFAASSDRSCINDRLNIDNVGHEEDGQASLLSENFNRSSILRDQMALQEVIERCSRDLTPDSNNIDHRLGLGKTRNSLCDCKKTTLELGRSAAREIYLPSAKLDLESVTLASSLASSDTSFHALQQAKEAMHNRVTSLKENSSMALSFPGVTFKGPRFLWEMSELSGALYRTSLSTF